jgi:glycosyltransferase involved in cell wall biosynthesis
VPRVSIIIPARNSAACVGATLDSVRAQSFQDWEVIVADDASTDDTAVVAASHPRVRVVRSDRNLGPAGARNLALRETSAELVAFLDADDRWLPTYLATQVARYDAERSRGVAVGLVACDARIEEGGRLLEYTYLEQFPAPVEPLSVERVLRRNCIFVSTLVPRAVGEEVGWFAEDLFGTEDHDLWLRILETGRSALLTPQPLAVYCRGPGTVSSNVARMGANNQLTYRRALARGRLTPPQQRIARSELRYNRAMEAVAAAWLDRRPGSLARALPTAAFVAATRPRHWVDWLRVLRRA